MNPPKYAILLCDDDRLILATVSSALRAAGMEVIEADNGDDAILLARQHRPDLAMLDMRMNGKSGLDVAAYLRDYVGTPFLFLSAFGDEESMRQAKAFGAIDFLVKPVDSRRIVGVVRAIVENLAAQRAPYEGGGLPLSSEPAKAGDPPLTTLPAKGGHPPSTTGPAEPAVWSRELAVAIGVLMERHAMNRHDAMGRLMALSRASGQGIDVVASDLVDRLERANNERP